MTINDVHYEELNILCDNFNSEFSKLAVTVEAINYLENTKDKIKKSLYKEVITTDSLMVCSERFNRFEELYPVYKNEFKINIESHGDLRDKLNSIYIHTEGVVDGLKTAGAKILEVIKTIWKKN